MTVLFILSVHMRVNNQQTLKADIEEYVQDDKLRAKMNSVSKTEKGHGRIETRSTFTTNDVSWMPGGRQWPGLKCIGAIRTHFEHKGKVMEEWHYYPCENGMGR